MLRFVLSEAGRVKIRIDRVRRGQKARRVAVLSSEALVSRGSVRFRGRLGRRVLSPGRYRVTLTATDSAGNRGRGRSLMLRLVR